MNSILVIEDDSYINNLLKEALEKDGYSCVQAFSGTEGRLLLERDSFDLILLDLMLPGLSGEELLSLIRKTNATPVIVLTAMDEIDQKVDVLKNGADDYVTKPFDIKEVLARIEVQLRKSRLSAAASPDNVCTDSLPAKCISYHGMTLDKNFYRITVDGQELPHLTRQEFSILELFLTNPARVFSKEDIFEYAWEDYYVGETKTLDVHISNIRKKIRKITPEEYIETVWGIGYRLKL